jgi:hypothetical protein
MRFRSMPLAVAGLAIAACQPAKKPAAAPTPANRPATNAAPGAPANGLPTPGQPTPGQPGQPPAGGLPNLAGLAGALGQQGEPNPRPYAQVITPRAKSKKGVFDVHQIGSRLFFEIPASQQGKDFLVTTVLAGTSDAINGSLYGPERVIRFERRDNRILVREASYLNMASDSMQQSRQAMNLISFFPIIATLNVEAYGKDSAAVVEVTRMFTGGTQEFTARGRRATVDASRSFVDKFSAFARNVNVTAVQTYTAAPGGGIPGLPIPGLGGGTGAATTEAFTFSLVRLPDEPMMPRLYDRRVATSSRPSVTSVRPSSAWCRATTSSAGASSAPTRRKGTSAFPRSPSRTTWIPPRRRISSRSSAPVSRSGRRRSKRPASRRASWLARRRPTIRTSPVKTRA